MRTFAASTALILAAGLAGCSTPPRTPEDAAGSSADAAAPLETGSEGWNRADLAFAEDMADHAERSVRLAEAALEVTDLPPEAEELAVQIRDEQEPQAETLRGYAEEWSSEEGASGANGTEDREEAGGVAGSEAMTEEMSDTAFDSEVEAVRDATGADAARLFLQGMIARHQAAIELADGESQLGTSTEAIGLAGAMSASQGEQLTKMQALLASYGG